MSSLLRKLTRASTAKREPHWKRSGLSLQKATAVANEKERRIARMQERIPALPPGVQKGEYIAALAHMRRTYPEKSGRALHDMAVEACIAFEHEKKVQRVLAGSKS